MRNTTLVKTANDFPIGECSLPIITVYKNPSDFPDKYVARLWDLPQPTKYAITESTLEELRKAIHNSKREWIKIPRSANDDPNIVETWI